MLFFLRHDKKLAPLRFFHRHLFNSLASSVFSVVTKMWNSQNGIHWNLNPILWNLELPKMLNLHRYHILTCVRVRVIHLNPYSNRYRNYIPNPKLHILGSSTFHKIGFRLRWIPFCEFHILVTTRLLAKYNMGRNLIEICQPWRALPKI